MSAKEMFEKYGFSIYDETDEIIIYCTDYDSEFQEDDHYIRFDKICKCIYSNKEFNIKELKMINKQVEELGWLGSEDNE